MPRISSLAEAHQHLNGSGDQLNAALKEFLAEKDYAKAQALWKDLHNAALDFKAAINGSYRHLSELKPKKADKLKPGGKLDNAPEGKQVDQKADAKRVKRDQEKGTNRAAKAGRRAAAETERTEAASDEPADDHDEP